MAVVGWSPLSLDLGTCVRGLAVVWALTWLSHGPDMVVGWRDLDPACLHSRLDLYAGSGELTGVVMQDGFLVHI